MKLPVEVTACSPLASAVRVVRFPVLATIGFLAISQSLLACAQDATQSRHSDNDDTNPILAPKPYHVPMHDRHAAVPLSSFIPPAVSPETVNSEYDYSN